MKPIKLNSKMYVLGKSDETMIRVYHRKAKGKQSPCYTLKCGDCNNTLKIYYDIDYVVDPFPALEINGVYGSIDNWKSILLPLLGIK